ncbi:MAG: hypothetical protein KAG64_04580 [Bacteroidales bacterium]|nr:hypothetical protein [Bacteroidales bacterium]
MIKKILILSTIIFFFSVPALCKDALNSRIVIVNTDSSYIVAYVSNSTKEHSKNLKDDLCYSWYRRNNIINTYGNYSGAILDGAYTEYDLKGNLLSKGIYAQGLKHEKWYFWSHGGAFLRTVSYKHGKLMGESIHYDNHGNPIYKALYRNGKQIGLSIKFVDSIIVSKTMYRKGRVSRVEYYEYGKKMKVIHYSKFGEVKEAKKKKTKNPQKADDSSVKIEDDISSNKNSKKGFWRNILKK